MKKISDFKDVDLYSLSMFILYKFIDIPEYSIVSELPYIMNKEDLLNLCNYFGGRTIRIPTTQELYSVMNLVLLYYYVKIDGKSFEDAFEEVGYKQSDRNTVTKAYHEIDEVLSKYQFGAPNVSR